MELCVVLCRGKGAERCNDTVQVVCLSAYVGCLNTVRYYSSIAYSTSSSTSDVSGTYDNTAMMCSSEYLATYTFVSRWNINGTYTVFWNTTGELRYSFEKAAMTKIDRLPYCHLAVVNAINLVDHLRNVSCTFGDGGSFICGYRTSKLGNWKWTLAAGKDSNPLTGPDEDAHNSVFGKVSS